MNVRSVKPCSVGNPADKWEEEDHAPKQLLDRSGLTMEKPHPQDQDQADPEGGTINHGKGHPVIGEKVCCHHLAPLLVRSSSDDKVDQSWRFQPRS